MTVAVCVPFRARNDHETRLWSWCEARWRSLFPDWQVCVADSGHEPFNRSASRNLAAEQCPDASCLIFSNSDTVPLDRANVLESVDVCELGGWCLPDRYFEVSESYTLTALESDPDGEMVDPWSSYDRQLEKSPAGPQVMPRSGFEAVNGFDERYVGWGREDDSVRDALDVLWAPHTRLGVSVHLHHERGREDTFRASGYPLNRQRHMQRYGRALKQRTPELRREWMLRAIADNRR